MTFESHYHSYGVAIIEWALEPADLTAMARAFTSAPRRQGNEVLRLRSGLGSSPGARAIPADLADWLETHPVLIEIASRLLADPARLVRILAFDKTVSANWFVPWHQDRIIAVEDRKPVLQFKNWSRKQGCWHVEPPIALLERMVTLRVHLDPCEERDGPLEVLPGTHAFGRLRRSDIGNVAATLAPQVCLADRGDILAMSPLTVHRSRRAKNPSRRRVLHLEFAALDLPEPLRWASLTPDLDFRT
ncbi:MAG: phytanoyl-CoA dioxygenase family protein [Pseudomonadota bacterium]